MAIGIETTIRNVNLGLMLKALLWPAAAGANEVGDAVLFVLLFYGGASLIAAVPPVLTHRWVLNPTPPALREPLDDPALVKAS